VLADDAAQIAGAARRDDGSLVPHARIVLVPGPNRRDSMTDFPTVEADERGVYTLEDIPPGEYRILALDVAGRTDLHPYWENPEFLRRYERLGERITVDPASRIVIDPTTISLLD
jgi:hypothetical protein